MDDRTPLVEDAKCWHVCKYIGGYYMYASVHSVVQLRSIKGFRNIPAVLTCTSHTT